MGRATLIRIRRGLRAAVASITDALDGEIFAATDTNELFLGESDGTGDPVQVDWANVLNKSHTHPASEITDLGPALGPLRVFSHYTQGGF